MNTVAKEFTPSAFSLHGRVIVLTGAAGLYGRGLAAEVARAGATLVLASRRLAAVEAVAADLRAEGFPVEARHLDQADEASVLALRDGVLAAHQRVNGLINNAVARPMRRPDAPIADWEASMKTNATGLFSITRAFGEVMAAAGGGSIVNVGSIQGMVGPDFTLYEGLPMDALPDYFFHKAGMVNLTRYFAAKLGPRGVRVNCVSPGGLLSGQAPEFVARYERATFLRRMANTTDLGGPIVFLLSDAAAYVTGANLPIDGGYTAH